MEEPNPEPNIDNLCVSADVREYALDRDVILFHERTGELFVLNRSGSEVWSRLKLGETCGGIAQRIARQAGVAVERVMGDCRQLVEQWARAGLVDTNGGADAQPNHGPTESRPALERNLPENDRRRPAWQRPRIPHGESKHRTYRLLDLDFELVSDDDELANDVDSLLGHLAVRRVPSRPPPMTLVTGYDRDGWLLLDDIRIVGRCATRSEVPSLVLGTMLAMASKASPSLAMFHSSAVARDGRCVLLPGASGSGKSTLTATLTASGYDFCTDDLAFLTRDPVGLRPVPLPLGLKSGAWPLLERFLPSLASAPDRPRADGRRIKYVLPRRQPSEADVPLAVSAIVFPVLTPGRGVTLEALPRADALVRIADAGYDLRGALDAAWVRAMTEWLQSVPCYELRYADLDEAVAAFSDVPI